MTRMRIDALLVDLDATLTADLDIVQDAFLAACGPIHERCGVDPAALIRSVRMCAHELWRASSHRRYCESIGVSSWEGLLAEFTGNTAELRRLRAWAPTYRRDAWWCALAQQGVDRQDVAEELAKRLRTERRKRGVRLFADAAEVLPLLACRLRWSRTARLTYSTSRSTLRVCGATSRP